MKIVIIGAGPAGVSAAETIRADDCESKIVMLSSEPYLPYSPPAMADRFIHGSKAHLWRDRNWLKQTGVDYRKGAEVVRIEPDAYRLGLRDGRTLKYDRLILATGRRLYAPVEGSDMPGVHNFKSLSAAEAIVEQVKRGKAKTAVIVSAGFIGMEIALLLRELGVARLDVLRFDRDQHEIRSRDVGCVASRLDGNHATAPRAVQPDAAAITDRPAVFAPRNEYTTSTCEARC